MQYSQGGSRNGSGECVFPRQNHDVVDQGAIPIRHAREHDTGGGAAALVDEALTNPSDLRRTVRTVVPDLEELPVVRGGSGNGGHHERRDEIQSRIGHPSSIELHGVEFTHRGIGRQRGPDRSLSAICCCRVGRFVEVDAILASRIEG